MALNKIIKLSFTCLFLFVAYTLYAQNDEKASLKPAATVDAKTDKKDKKKAAKAEEKIHNQSKNDMDKQISEYHKPHYKKITKQKPAAGKSDKGL
jgi:hypothetical protein